MAKSPRTSFFAVAKQQSLVKDTARGTDLVISLWAFGRSHLLLRCMFTCKRHSVPDNLPLPAQMRVRTTIITAYQVPARCRPNTCWVLTSRGALMSTGGILTAPRSVREVLLLHFGDGGAQAQRSQDSGQHPGGNGPRTQVCSATKSSCCVYLILGM